MDFNKSLFSLETDDSFYKATQKIAEYKSSHPNHHVISLGIGDVSFPIPSFVAEKMIEAIKTESSSNYVGYGNYYGLKELRKAIKDHEYPNFSIDEIYVSHGSKSDSGDILELFDKDVLIGIPSPTYPIYENNCKSLQKRYEIIKCNENFVPIVPNKHYDVIYLCSPNNPVGISYTYDELSAWVNYANEQGAVILYDNVYYQFINSGIKSIYEIKGAEKCAIEMRSFSKHVSFTGIRCSYYVIPNSLHIDVNKYWKLRTISRFNGASYIAQIGALASFDDKAQKEIKEHIKCYQQNASLLLDSFKQLGFEVYGGKDAPYLWIKCKHNLKSWEMFDLYLNKLEVVIVPGAIFGSRGNDYFRISALGKTSDIKEALKRIKQYEQED